MGIIICEKHGHQGFISMCQHGWQQYRLGHFPVLKRVGLLLGGVCEQCYNKYQLDSIQEYHIDNFDKYTDEEFDFVEKVLNVFQENEGKYMKSDCVICYSLCEFDNKKNSIPQIWTPEHFMGLHLKLADSTRILSLQFHNTGNTLSATIGSIDGAIATPVWSWRLENNCLIIDDSIIFQLMDMTKWYLIAKDEAGNNVMFKKVSSI